MEQTLFYVFGIMLVASALVVAIVGLRWERFPASGAILAAVAAYFVALVAATGTFAWLNASNEQDEHAAEHAAERAKAAEEEAAEEQQTVAEVEGEAPAGGGGAAASAEGQQLFDDQGCSGCHTLSAAGATATVGPNLDDVLANKSPQFIEESIVDPNAEIAKGYPKDVMPPNFGDVLDPDQVKALVDYLSQSTQ
jgi:mono/diheme cytochrome c family protein